MDGTLWDSAAGVAASWNEVFETEDPGRTPLTKQDIMNVMGLTMKDIADVLFHDLSPERRYALLSKCMDHENEYLLRHGGTLYPALEETLITLSSRFPLFIVSNCQSGYIEAFLSHYGFAQYFTDYGCYGDNSLPKDENIRLVARRNHLDRYFYIGDIQGDYDATVAAGGSFIHAAYGFGKIAQNVPCIHEFKELPALLDELLQSQ